MPAKAITKAQSEIIKGVESYLNIPLTARSFYVKNNVIGLDIAGLQQYEIHAVENYGRQFARFRVEPGGYKKVSLILMKPQNTPKENPMKRKPTPAQIAARERFAEMARSGAFKKKAKRNPAKKTVSQKISQLTREGYPQKQAVAIALNEERAGKVKRNPIEKHLGGTTYGIIREEVFGYGDKRYRAMIVQKSKTGVPGEVATDLLDAKSFKTKAGAERFLESYERKTNPRAANPIVLVTDRKPSKRKSNPAKAKRQRMLNISWVTAGGAREMKSVPIDFTFTHYVGNVAEKFFARTENGQLIVSEYSTGGRIGQVPYTMRAAALNDRAAAKMYVGEMLSRIGAERYKAAVKKFDPIN